MAQVSCNFVLLSMRGKGGWVAAALSYSRDAAMQQRPSSKRELQTPRRPPGEPSSDMLNPRRRPPRSSKDEFDANLINALTTQVVEKKLGTPDVFTSMWSETFRKEDLSFSRASSMQTAAAMVKIMPDAFAQATSSAEPPCVSCLSRFSHSHPMLANQLSSGKSSRSWTQLVSMRTFTDAKPKRQLAQQLLGLGAATCIIGSTDSRTAVHCREINSAVTRLAAAGRSSSQSGHSRIPSPNANCCCPDNLFSLAAMCVVVSGYSRTATHCWPINSAVARPAAGDGKDTCCTSTRSPKL